MNKRPVVLIILDGFGINPDPQARGNAIALARKPNWDRLLASNPHSRIPTSGGAVGLPPGQQGNSEVGHLNMGAGRVVYQDLMRINKSIHDGDFFQNPVLRAAMEHARRRGTALHLLGLISDGGVHSHEEHVYALLRMARDLQVGTVWVHAFTDGRDTPPTAGIEYVRQLEARLSEIGCGRVATVSGRYYAMDRDKRWERTRRAWAAMVLGESDHAAPSGTEAMARAYDRGETDEFVAPTVVAPEGVVSDGDAVLFCNFRPDRARQITRALATADFSGFERSRFPKIDFTCITEYDVTLGLPVAFPKQSLARILSPIVADAGMRQLRCAETEKYAHVTFFFNGGIEKPWPGEERVLIPSPRVATYDLQPEMSAFQVAETAADWISRRASDLVILNFANADMVGHTGNLEAAIKAVEAVDHAVGTVVHAVESAGGVALVTADHGNAEMMIDPETGDPHTAHTLFPVPSVLVGAGEGYTLREGLLSDVAPTLLELLGLPKPPEMTASSLLVPSQTPALR
ncbi:MAG: 2,3-bisphosphoglycerate-independent phosphoglycerate mutase [Candidatus Sericytochromatia bacterium]|nr:2,3-bisphosphoglycerate-independent phosphoglycerate mutase [Candidatus Tanganyikabacteria bacterium]